jgi:hypothetical protein
MKGFRKGHFRRTSKGLKFIAPTGPLKKALKPKKKRRADW